MEYATSQLGPQAGWLAEENELQLRVTQMVWESERVLSVVLQSLNGHDLPPWQPGAHIDLYLSGSLVRQYSLSGDPGDLSRYRVGVLREETGLGGSRYVHETLRVGDQVRVVGPRNRFPMLAAESYLFIAGGIGITPMLPMIRAAEQAGTPWRLLYAGRERHSLAYRAELEGYGDRVAYFPADEDSFLDLGEIVGGLETGEHIYVCGPEGLLSALEEACAEVPEVLHLERFKPKTRDTEGDVDEVILVEARRSGKTVSVPPEQSVLMALADVGIKIPYSCEEGVCGSCETRVLEGVPDHRDSLLSPSEQASGKTMMVCVSRAKTPALVLDV